MDAQREPRLVGEFPQADLPEPDRRTVATAAIGRDRQLAHVRVALAPHAVEPGLDRGNRKLRCIPRNSNADPAFVGRALLADRDQTSVAHLVHAVRGDLAECFVFEVVNLDA